MRAKPPLSRCHGWIAEGEGRHTVALNYPLGSHIEQIATLIELAAIAVIECDTQNVLYPAIHLYLFMF